MIYSFISHIMKCRTVLLIEAIFSCYVIWHWHLHGDADMNWWTVIVKSIEDILHLSPVVLFTTYLPPTFAYAMQLNRIYESPYSESVWDFRWRPDSWNCTYNVQNVPKRYHILKFVVKYEIRMVDYNDEIFKGFNYYIVMHKTYVPFGMQREV